jgi:hypothetical protein
LTALLLCPNASWPNRSEWPNYYLPFLVRAAQNARKWFATVEIERMSCDPNWLGKAIRIVKKQIQEMNRKQRGKEQSEMALVQ